MQLELVDIGVNLGDSAFDKDRDDVVERALEAGVSTMILTGTTLEESIACLKLTEQYKDYCYTTAGIHPHYAKDATDQHFNELKSLYAEDKVVAVGEAGLDFNRDFSPRPIQEQVFEKQIELAIETGLPLFCHERDASKRFADIVKAYRDDIADLVVHCFTADKESLYRYLDLDLHIGITGWVCDERRGFHLHPLLRDIPANRLMVETDCPYLLPRTLKPKPKSRRNEPAYLGEVISMIASQLDKSVEQVAEETTRTAKAFFRI
ncbi:TatD family hydrolase [Parendozoicomonas haliclonae]|uniref:Tat-linked quality control protein TatD n=1 Tax=Parendozoicomonas haliclonae TaxID=1960125 RepID=A0A1X7AMQ4_9GAMM|nr:TatD family hydrolase [Parendozoicomonas haliclonae]SMA49558.1 Tat-linked quality control protein TatD [Parendozoicomonas haliclonae]